MTRRMSLRPFFSASTGDDLKTQKVTIQGRLKDLTQRELMFRLQDFHNQQQIENKEMEYQMQISDAQV